MSVNRYEVHAVVNGTEVHYTSARSTVHLHRVVGKLTSRGVKVTRVVDTKA